MADEFDVAGWLFGAKRLETGRGSSAMHACTGTATSDSDAGRVSVTVGDDATTVKVGGEGEGMGVVEGDTSLSMPTTVRVKEGDTAIVAVVNHRPTVIGVVGRGDEEHDDLVDAQVEQEQAMAVIRESVASVKADADATSAKADALIAEIDDVTVTVGGVELKGLDNLVASIQGSIDKGDANAEAITTVEQTINSFTVSSGKGYKDLVSTLKADSSLTITPDEIKGVVTKNYMSTTLGDTYTSLATVKQNADSIISEVSTSALNNAIGTSYVASSSTIQTASQITTRFTEQGNQITAQGTRVTNLESYIRLCSAGVLVGQTGKPVAALVNSQGTFDVVTVTWSNGEPTISAKLMTLSGDTLTLGRADSAPEVRLTDAKNKVYSSTLTQTKTNPVSGDSESQTYNFAGLQSYNTTARPARVLAMSNSTESRAVLQSTRNSSVSVNLGTFSSSSTAYAYTDRFFKLVSPNLRTYEYTNEGDGVISEPQPNTSATVTGQSRIVFVNWDDRTLGTVAARQYANGRQAVYMEAHSVNSSGTDFYNTLSLLVGKDGKRYVTVSEAAPWRAALGLGTDGSLPVTVAQGGTGGTTAAEARKALAVGHESGATISGTCWVGGFLTNSGKSHMFTIPLTKHVNGTLICTRLLVTARQDGGYILGNGSSGYDAVADGSTTKTFTVSPSGINVRLDLASSVGGTNNDMVGYAVTYAFTVS